MDQRIITFLKYMAVGAFLCYLSFFLSYLINVRLGMDVNFAKIEEVTVREFFSTVLPVTFIRIGPLWLLFAWFFREVETTEYRYR